MRFDQMDEFERRGLALPSGERIALFEMWCEKAGRDRSKWDEDHEARWREHEAALRRDRNADRVSSVVQVVQGKTPGAPGPDGSVVVTRSGMPCVCAVCGGWLRVVEVSAKFTGGSS